MDNHEIEAAIALEFEERTKAAKQKLEAMQSRTGVAATDATARHQRLATAIEARIPAELERLTNKNLFEVQRWWIIPNQNSGIILGIKDPTRNANRERKVARRRWRKAQKARKKHLATGISAEQLEDIYWSVQHYMWMDRYFEVTGWVIGKPYQEVRIITRSGETIKTQYTQVLILCTRGKFYLTDCEYTKNSELTLGLPVVSKNPPSKTLGFSCSWQSVISMPAVYLEDIAKDWGIAVH